MYAQVLVTRKYYSHDLMSIGSGSLLELGELPYVGKFYSISF
jgi:hypothetical protein